MVEINALHVKKVWTINLDYIKLYIDDEDLKLLHHMFN